MGQDPQQPTSDGASLFLPDAAATDQLGAALSQLWRPGLCVFLIGDLGAGKSALARAAILTAMAREGREEPVPSPTFTLAQIYEAEGVAIAHCDLYRLTDPEETLELGLEEALSDGVALIEWPERLEHLTPKDRLEIALEIGPQGAGRRVHLRGLGAARDVAEALASAFALQEKPS